MSTTANRTRGAVPTKVAAAVAVVALLATPAPVGANSQSRTLLLTLTSGTNLTELAADVSALGGRVLDTLGLSDSLLVELPEGVDVPAGSAAVPDVPMRVNGTHTAYDAKVPTYRETIGLDASQTDLGAGVTVALVDTGVDPGADGLGHVQHVNVSGAKKGDGLGHGTFLAGIIGGNGQFKGVAPAANLVDIQVADRDGSTSLVKVLKGIEAADDADADVVNLSLSTDSPLPPGFDPLSRALERLWAKGATVVTAAGNDGPDKGTVGAPGDNPVLLTVGALDEAATADVADDTVADFSSRGSLYDTSKPDLVAPGVSLVSTSASGSKAAKENPESLVEGGYMRGSGTSMAAAVVSGAAAAILSARSSLEPNGVKALLKSSADATRLGVADGAGSGSLDLAAALKAAPAAAANPSQPKPNVADVEFGPEGEDAAVWAKFAKSWEDGDTAAALRAWRQLAPRTRVWAARAWSMAVVSGGLGLKDGDFEARAWSARAWSAEEWLARAWSDRAWSARAWSDEEWLARAWSARAWSDEAWLARAWSARAWSVEDWAARAWSARAWSGFDWDARAWSARAWSARAWSARAWSARAWSARAWSARAWSDYVWDARAWSTDGWVARAWSGDTWA